MKTAATVTPPVGVVYLHGFRSSPASTKAVQIGEWLKPLGVAYACPALDIDPAKAYEQAAACLDEFVALGLAPRLIGSSLGGHLAISLIEDHPAGPQSRAALLNPAVWAHRDLASQVGTHPAWHSGEPLVFTQGHVETLRQQHRRLSHPERVLLVAAKGDELLDWREMVEATQGARQLLIDGSDHGLSDFADHWPTVRDFLLAP